MTALQAAILVDAITAAVSFLLAMLGAFLAIRWQRKSVNTLVTLAQAAASDARDSLYRTTGLVREVLSSNGKIMDALSERWNKSP